MEIFDNFFKKLFGKSMDKNVDGLLPDFPKKGGGYTDTMQEEMVEKYNVTTNSDNIMNKVNEMKKRNPEIWGK